MSAVLSQLPELPKLVDAASTLNGKPLRSKPRVVLGDLTTNNLGTVKKLHACLFPVSYSTRFYADLLDKKVTPEEYNKLVFYQDLPVGVLVCRLEKVEDGKEGEGMGEVEGEERYRLYVMTLGVLAPYRNQGLASKLVHHLLTSASSTHSQPPLPSTASASSAAPAPSSTPTPSTSSSSKKGKGKAPPPPPPQQKKADDNKAEEKKDEEEPEPRRPVVESLYLHVHVGNEQGRRFWEKWGFEVKDTVKDYYRKLEPRDAWLLERKVGPLAA
ncbi:hypothetical protein JCM11251_003091 [Rhodosporidiobolus azoricus]